LGLGSGDAPAERDYKRLSKSEMTVWDDAHPRPIGGPEFERKLLHWWKDDASQQLAAALPKDQSSLQSYQKLVAPALDIVIGRSLPDAKDLAYEQSIKEDRGDYLLMAGLLRNQSRAEELPILFFHPKQWQGEAIIWLHENGKAGLLDGNEPSAEVKKLIAAGKSVVGVDLIHQGEFLEEGKSLEKTPTVKNSRQAAAYTLGYNHSVFAQRVHDVLSVTSFVKNHEQKPKSITLVGLGGAPGAWATCARVQAGNAVDRIAVDTAGFRFQGVADIRSADLLPGAAKYGDLPGFLAVAAPGRIWLAGEKTDAIPSIKAAYQASGSSDNLVLHEGARESIPAAAVEWLMK
jgi:hypothetical protein